MFALAWKCFWFWVRFDIICEKVKGAPDPVAALFFVPLPLPLSFFYMPLAFACSSAVCKRPEALELRQRPCDVASESVRSA